MISQEKIYGELAILSNAILSFFNKGLVVELEHELKKIMDEQELEFCSYVNTSKEENKDDNDIIKQKDDE